MNINIKVRCTNNYNKEEVHHTLKGDWKISSNKLFVFIGRETYETNS